MLSVLPNMLDPNIVSGCGLIETDAAVNTRIAHEDPVVNEAKECLIIGHFL